MSNESEITPKQEPEQMKPSEWSWSDAKSIRDQEKTAIFVTPDGNMHHFKSKPIDGVTAIQKAETITHTAIWARGTNYTFKLEPGVRGLDLTTDIHNTDSLFKQSTFETALEKIQTDNIYLPTITLDSFKHFLESEYPEDYQRFWTNQKIRQTWQLQDGGYQQRQVDLKEHSDANGSPSRLCLLRKGHLYRFTGEDIDEVVRVENRVYTKSGHWSKDTYDLVIRKDTKINIPTDHSQMITWSDYEAELITLGIRVGEDSDQLRTPEIHRFLNENFPKVAQRFDEVATLLSDYTIDNPDGRTATIQKIDHDKLEDSFIYDYSTGKIVKLSAIDTDDSTQSDHQLARQVLSYRTRKDSLGQTICYVFHANAKRLYINEKVLKQAQTWAELIQNLDLGDQVDDTQLRQDIQTKFPRNYERLVPEVGETSFEFPADTNSFFDIGLDALTAEEEISRDKVKQIGRLGASGGKNVPGDYLDLLNDLPKQLLYVGRDRLPHVKLNQIDVKSKPNSTEADYQERALQILSNVQRRLTGGNPTVALKQLIATIDIGNDRTLLDTIVGHYGYLMATPEQRRGLKIENSLKNTPTAVTRPETAMNLPDAYAKENKPWDVTKITDTGQRYQVILASLAQGSDGYTKLWQWGINGIPPAGKINELNGAMSYMKKADPYLDQETNQGLQIWVSRVETNLERYQLIIKAMTNQLVVDKNLSPEQIKQFIRDFDTLASESPETDLTTLIETALP